jgi:hypothetical protein
MSKFWHVTVQVLLTLGQAAVVASKAIPTPYGAIIAGGVAATQGIIAIVNHGKGK